MRRFLALLLALGAALGAGCDSVAIPGPPPRTTAVGEASFAEAISESRRVVDARLRDSPGIVVAVSAGGRLVWNEAAGWANVETREPLRADALLRPYSVTKPITASLAVKLAGEGRLDLDAPIAKYLPDLPAPLRLVTSRQLLGHLSGVRHYREHEWLSVSRSACERAADALAPFRNDPLESPPGRRFHYSSFGYVLESAVIEAATGSRFFPVLRSEILAPAGMTSVVPDTPSDEAGRTVRFYERTTFKRVLPSPKVDNSCKFGAGGILATAADLVAFGDALLSDALLPAGERAALFETLRTSDGKPTDYGLGWGLRHDDRLGEIAAHSGSGAGGTSYLLLSREKKIVVAILANVETERFGKEAEAIARSFARRQ